MSPESQSTPTPEAGTPAGEPTAAPVTALHMTQTLAELQAAVLADGVIDADEVTKLRQRVFADGVVDKEEADLLFALNDAVSGKPGQSPRFGALFVEGVSAHVLEDEANPVVIWFVDYLERTDA